DRGRTASAEGCRRESEGRGRRGMTETERALPTRAGSAKAVRDSPIAVRAAVAADLDVIVAMRMALLRSHGGHAVYGRLRADADARAGKLFARQIEARDEV